MQKLKRPKDNDTIVILFFLLVFYEYYIRNECSNLFSYTIYNNKTIEKILGMTCNKDHYLA
jgi:hypothetical protein